MLYPGLTGPVLKRNIQGYIESIGDGVGGADRPGIDMSVRVNERMIERVIPKDILARVVITKENRGLPLSRWQG
jgi:hypothetical protein